MTEARRSTNADRIKNGHTGTPTRETREHPVTILSPKNSPAAAQLARFQKATALLGVALGIAAVWTIFRPYTGIRHDARLYTLLAAAGGDPAFVGADLMVGHDPVSGRSVYPGILRLLMEGLSLEQSAIVATIVGLLAWIGATLYLGITLNRRGWWWLPSLVMVSAFPFYGGLSVFSIAEQFAVPRGIAEASALVGVVMAFASRRVPALLAIGIAIVFHPLMALPAGVLAGVLAIRWTKGRVIGGVVIGVLGALAIWLDPFVVGGSRVFSDEWLAVVRDRSPFLFLSNWQPREWLQIAISLGLMSAAVVDPGLRRMRRLFVSIAVVAGLGLAASYILGDLALSPLGVQLQMWRSTWLLHVGGLLAIAAMSWQALETRSREDSARLLLALLSVSIPVFVPDSGSVVLVTLALGLVIALGHPGGVSLVGRTLRQVHLLSLVLLASLYLLSLYALVSGIRADIVVLVFPGFGLSVAACIAGLMHLGNGHRGIRHIAIGSLAVICAVGMASWDARSEWAAYVESLDRPVIDSEPDDIVAMEDPDLGAWFIFGRPHYFSQVAGAGVVFSEDLATQFEVRRSRLLEIDFIGSHGYAHDLPAADREVGPPKVEAIRSICAGEGGPTILALRRESPDLAAERWVPPVRPPDLTGSFTGDSISDDSFYIYRCDSIS